jgi:hypothetical protein
LIGIDESGETSRKKQMMEMEAEDGEMKGGGII